MSKTLNLIRQSIHENGCIRKFVSGAEKLQKLKEKVLERMTAPETEQEQECFDSQLRYSYAKSVGLGMGLHGNALNLFIKLREAKVWDWIYPDLRTFLDFYDEIKDELDSTGVWGIGPWSIAELARKGLTMHQIKILMKMGKTACLSQNMGNRFHYFQSGCHFGEWFSEMSEGVGRNHIRYFWTFLRVFKHTRKIDSKITGRYLRVLQSLDYQSLFYTVTDSRNWSMSNSINLMGNMYRRAFRHQTFRMTKIVRSVKNWRPIRKNHQVDQAWLASVGRVPQSKEVRQLIPLSIVAQLTKKSWGKLLKWAKRENISLNTHEFLAAVKLTAHFGPSWGFVNEQINNIRETHDYGIELPDEPMSKEHHKFLKRYVHRWNDALNVVKSWEAVKNEGVNPLDKEGLELSIHILKSMVYENAKNRDFAVECARWGYSQSQFEKLQDLWIKGIENLTQQSIPKVDFLEGEFRCSVLSKDDPRGVFLGKHTGCCQHPDGEGASCAQHGHESPDGGFFVIEKKGKVIAQSWIWRKDDTLVFDNIEGGYDDNKVLADLYTKTAERFKSSLEISRTLVGTGGSDVMFDMTRKENQLLPTGYSGYTDSRQVWEI